jgi:catechol 2,3-dioxygenase-like lactoylglutathione lyase family enzyme
VSVKVWYHVRDLGAARAFYTTTLGFDESHAEEDWVRLISGPMEIGITQGEPSESSGVATIDVSDVKAEAERLRAAGVEVGVVLELHGQMRLLDVFDPDGNRIQLAQVLGEPEPV